MRRFPAKSNQSQTDLNARAPSPPPASPLQEWNQGAPAATATTPTAPAFSYSSIAASNVRSQNGPSGSVSIQESSAIDGSMIGNNGSSISNYNNFATDSLNPFKYSKDLMLSLYRPTGLPIEFERHEIMTSEESLGPMSLQSFSELEIKLLAGSVNSEMARRTVQPGEGQEKLQGQRRESFSSSGEHLSGRYDRSEKGTSHSRNFDSRSHGAGSRPRNLNSEGRSHSFRRTEQQQHPQQQHIEREREREPEDDGLWSSPVGNTVGLFDANGVFRVVGDGDELQPLAALPESTPEKAADEGKDAGVEDEDGVNLGDSNMSSASQAAAHPDHEIGEAGVSSLNQQRQQQQHDNAGDNFHFSSALLGGSAVGSISTHEDEFSPFSADKPPLATAAHAGDPPLESLPTELSKWLYRDPSGSIQGPFSSEDMQEWFNGGFFTADLLVKREQDPTFEPLGALIRRIGSDEKPFLIAGIIRQEQAPQSGPGGRPPIPSLNQNRMPLSQLNQSPGWMGMSAPSTPSTPSFGVDRLLMKQQQQHPHQLQQHSSGDLFSSANTLGQQRTGFGSAQDPAVSMGLDSRWSGSGLFGRGQMPDSTHGWAGDAFSRSPMAAMSQAHTPLGGPHFIEQQQRMQHQELERQQYMQLLQRQSQMQAMMHQQQFMAAQQQFGNDPHALANLLAQQQAQQRQLQMRYQQFQFAALHGQEPLTPGGTAVPWGRLAQPTSPWTTSIIPSNDDYFDLNKGDGGQAPHSMQQRQQQQQQQQQQAFQQQHQQLPQEQSQQQHQPFQPFQHEQEQQSRQHVHQDESVSIANDGDQQLAHELSHVQQQMDDRAIDSLANAMQRFDVHTEAGRTQEEPEAPKEQEHPTELEQQVALEPAAVSDVPVEPVEMIQKAVQEREPQENEHAFEQQQMEDEVEEHAKEQEETESVEENLSEAASSITAEPSRSIKASPAPWAKPSKADEESSEKKGPTLREIQEMEARKAEETRLERQAQLAVATAAGHSNILDYTKGMSGGPAWSSTTATPKKKTLKEIQEEEEAAMKSAKAAAQQVSPTVSLSGATSTGLAAIVASGTGSASKRYADTIGPKPVTVTASSGPWATMSAAATSSVSRPTLTNRSSAVFASNPSVNAPANSVSKVSDNNSWIEVGAKKDIQASAPSASPTVSRVATTTTTTTASSNVNKSTNSNEPRPPSEDFLRWCRQALKGLQGVVAEDIIQMLLTLPLNDPMTVEIIQDSIYASSQSLNGRQFADEFIRRRKADAFPNGGHASSSSASGSMNSGMADSSFKVVSKKGKKKGTA
ncbi:hypothetical protein BG011_006183 [Mortierella polycephala]|uniref:GYF domain-containing protein n=1 Tax=Mortierella polycephala TaxID=41804 RepID=A0A9P6U9B2_9FUNG|nr:hypothetical protein BG011_006183 [Mortierella polycephala]